MKASLLRSAGQLIDMLDQVTKDLEHLESDTTGTMVVRIGNGPQLKYKPSASLYLDFLIARKTKLEDILSKMGVDVTG